MPQIQRDSNGNAIFPTYNRHDGVFLATDAKIIGELPTAILSATTQKNIPDEPRQLENLIMTTPNADYLPKVNLGHQFITMYEDGRWGAEDWAQWPQFYFDGQEHFPYVLRKPSEQELASHPLRLLWWDMDISDFDATCGAGIGVLKPKIAEELYNIRVNLMHEVEKCACLHGGDFAKLQQCARMMRNCTSSVRYTPQPFLDIMVMVAAAQRYCLETRAMLDKIQKWDLLPAPTTPCPADHTILGCITNRLPIAFDMFEKGVPVWLVRPPSHLSPDMNIVEQRFFTLPVHRGICMKKWKGFPIFYQGPLSREIHASIERWKPGNLDLRLLEQVQPALDEDRGDAETQSTNSESRSGGPYSKTQALVRVTSKKLQISVNIDNFDEGKFPYSAKPLNAWKDGLSKVDHSVARVINHPSLHLFRGYAFPPRRLFCRENDETNLALAMAWLVVRPSWFGIIGDRKRSLPLPNPQQWRQYLHDVSLELELGRVDRRNQQPTPSTSTGKVGKSRKKTKLSTKTLFPFPLPSKDTLTEISWMSRIVWQRDNSQIVLLTPLDRKLISWDLQEHNFRLELLALDRCILGDAWKTSEGRTIREEKLGKVWPNDVILMLGLPSGSTGIAADHLFRRAPYLKAFQDIIIDWPGDVPQQLAHVTFYTKGTSGEDIDLVKMSAFENQASMFYCQTFFDYFGRAPCVPYTFPTL